jgi:hypothetical protein
VKATGAKQAFAVSSHEGSPLKDFVLKNWDVEAASAGSVKNASGWTLEQIKIKTADPRSTQQLLQSLDHATGQPQE